MYNFDFEKINKEIKKRKAKRVLIQLPEGLKPRAREIMENIRAESVLSADPCYGACDVLTIPVCDLTIHFGHTRMVNEKKVIYVPVKMKLDPLPSVEKALKFLSEKRIGLVTTAQHLDKLDEIAKFLRGRGKEVFVGGQVLGCDCSAAKRMVQKVDAFLFFGSGRFHPLLVAHSTYRRTIAADPYLNRAEEVKDAWAKEEILRLAKSRDAGRFGIVVSSKPGQRHWKLAEKVKRKIECRNRQAFFIYINEITPDTIDYLPFDAFVITACPRIVWDDWKNYKKPILLPDEV